jgi:mono/diheme cytochrome c family protein
MPRRTWRYRVQMPHRPWPAVMAFSMAVLLTGCGASSASAPPAGPSAPAVESPTPADVLARGAALYAANCQSCHGDAHTGAGRLPHVPSHGPDGHTWHHSDRNLTEIILDGSGEMGDMMRRMEGVPEDAPRMPAWRGKLSEADIAAILAYIKAGWTPEQREFQQKTPMMR